MGQDIHVYAQDGERSLGERVRVGRDPELFRLMGVGGGRGSHPEAHGSAGLPAIACPEVADALFVPAGGLSAPRYRIEAGERIVASADGPFEVHPDWHSLTHMDATELERILVLWGAGIDYGLTSARADGVGPDEEIAIALGLGPELEVPWFEPWQAVPGPRIEEAADLVRLVIFGVLPRRELEPALVALRAEGSVLLRRYGHRPPEMGDSWRPRGAHPTLGPLVERMREIEAAGGQPQVVVFFDN